MRTRGQALARQVENSIRVTLFLLHEAERAALQPCLNAASAQLDGARPADRTQLNNLNANFEEKRSNWTQGLWHNHEIMAVAQLGGSRAFVHNPTPSDPSAITFTQDALPVAKERNAEP